MKNSKINQQIWDIWLKYWKDPRYTKITDLLPLFYDDYFGVNDSLLVIGANPSFNENYIQEDKIKLKFDAEKSYVKKEMLVDWIISFEEKAIKEYKNYYGKIKELVKETGFGEYKTRNGWLHVDLFLCRKTDQKEAESLLFSDKDKNVLTEFGNEQVKICLELIKLINPKIILVANAMVSHVLKDELSKKKEFGMTEDPELGTYTINITNRKIPIFFSSALSGGRLDNGSYARLIWHIKFVKKKLDEIEFRV